MLGGLYGWVFEPVDDPNADGHHDDDFMETQMNPELKK